ncbi:LuxR family transcriptional regulator [Flavobacterium branchiophilum]|uniref:LuxR family transcriptional regulator n=2 Tax=Flavobacterium branchiophilum TaxID=55197 RepID=A0A2H3KU45_9FLAO|nr:LuxR family transcriptional regulator [Flavobacterium branchiophilum]
MKLKFTKNILIIVKIVYMIDTCKNLFVFILVCLLFDVSVAQELPPIIQYNTSTYGAGNQSWMITQDRNHYMYFANNEGLMEFNGANWTLYPSPNETIIRSVKVVDDKIFMGCYMEFGYWKRQTNGKLVYTSLSRAIKKQLIEDEHFWNILSLDQYILFQSFNRIYVYNTKSKSFQIIKNHPYIFRCYKVNNSIYFQAIGEGIFEIVNGKSQLITNDEQIKNNRIVEIFKTDLGLLLQTERAGVFKLEGDQIMPFHFESEAELKPNSIFCAQKLSDGGFALGTISNGIYILNHVGKIKYHITQNMGLSNNTVLCLNEDSDNNLWLGLDNGINCINLQSPIKNYKDDIGFLGTVYASAKFEDNIYIGTNQGLYYKKWNSNEAFRFVTGTKGQVWTLFPYKNQLFCGHDMGTFLIKKNSIQIIYKQSGTWKFNVLPHAPHLILQGNYNGLSVLEEQNGSWVFRNKLQGYDISSRYFEVSNKNDIYVGHEYKGILKIIPDQDFSKVKHFSILNHPIKGKHISLAQYNGQIFYAGKQGIFRLNNQTNQFEKEFSMSQIFMNNEYISGKMNIDNTNKMWFFTKHYMYYFTSGNFDSNLKKHKIPIPFSTIFPMIGYENIAQIANNEYLVGKTDGYFIINLYDFKVKPQRIYITNITVNKLNSSNDNLSITETGTLSHDANNLVFNFTVPQYNKFLDVEYQYVLVGLQNEWSEWSSKTTVNFKNLEPGDYVFKVKAKIANTNSENEAMYRFTIKKPWYASTLALLIYFVVFGVMAYYINKFYKIYYQKQEQKLIAENNRLLEIAALENEQQLMKLKNEQLSQDVDAKSKELAVSTMSLIKKNELLELIKEDLKKTSKESENRSIKSMISTINKNITEEDNWNKFREAYDTTDKDFLKKMKTAHPSLTPSDLKLCAYLRLNLSSKEIAPMLHISIRSVEVKRYRLRKKLNLEHDAGLVNYILGI